MSGIAPAALHNSAKDIIPVLPERKTRRSMHCYGASNTCHHDPQQGRAMSIPPTFLDEIRSRIKLSDLVGRKVKLTRAGRELKGLCPFHNEKTPSFTVTDAKNFCWCYGCERGGDQIAWI